MPSVFSTFQPTKYLAPSTTTATSWKTLLTILKVPTLLPKRVPTTSSGLMAIPISFLLLSPIVPTITAAINSQRS
ncbi:UNVERIFIED_CONTAM: hypothetical protein GTU68_057464 [Idotea baltica]|nr:hypothetical protein [Idotea baltica]